jgi:hypothetical protein
VHWLEYNKKNNLHTNYQSALCNIPEKQRSPSKELICGNHDNEYWESKTYAYVHSKTVEMIFHLSNTKYEKITEGILG